MMRTALLILGSLAAAAAAAGAGYIAGGYTCHTQRAIKIVRKDARKLARDAARKMSKYATEDGMSGMNPDKIRWACDQMCRAKYDRDDDPRIKRCYDNCIKSEKR